MFYGMHRAFTWVYRLWIMFLFGACAWEPVGPTKDLGCESYTMPADGPPINIQLRAGCTDTVVVTFE